MSNQKNKILTHPEKEEIISRLLQGESVKKIESWLKKKHPRTKRLWVSYVTLQKFRKNYLNLEGEVLDHIKAAKQSQDDESADLEAKAILAGSSAYQKKINEIADQNLDANKKILEMTALISSRIEYYFNALQTSGDIKKDKMFVELLNTQRALVQDWKKYVEGVADQKIEHNISINVVNEQVNVLKSIVFEVLQELDPSLIPLFIQKINSKMVDTNFGSQRYKEYAQIEVIDE